ncbi:shikimate dehydrogenase family protein [Maribacter sp. CXY002]|uniref:shikimate dehydrogenase family protein n=1 Tax=Maribacter luteocoastalis TaxID=3407671 RepID=UPI003B685E39
MEKIEGKQYKFGLVGRNISYSFSRGYFAKKFEKLGLKGYSYENFDLSKIEEFKDVITKVDDLKGLNVTIPYKQDVIPYLDKLSDAAKKIGAVNTIKISEKGLIGHNTDAYGFQKSIEPYLKKHHNKALILGTGGASKAIAYVLDNLNIAYAFVSRTGKNNGYTYEELSKKVLQDHLVIINCTPIGTFPDIEAKPNLPYQHIVENHLLFDLIYNPEKTAFLKKGEEKGATILNGAKMLELQAEQAWKIWNT